MMVIRGVRAGNTEIHPADRCTWRQAAVATGGYEVNNVVFYPGNAAGEAVTQPELGFIGKSGRFVPITN